MIVIQELGEELKARRGAMGLSRQEAYKKFRVPLPFISAIEEGRVENLPPPIYTRGFIKTYCEALCVTPDSFINAYEDALHKPVRGFSLRRVSQSPNRPAWFDDAVTWAAIVGIVIVSWISYTLVVRPGNTRAASSVQAETVELPITDPFAAP